MSPHSAIRLHRVPAALLTVLLACAGLASAETSLSNESARALSERARTAKRMARAPLLPQTRYTVRKQIESIEPITWLERYGKVQIRELER